ncbi:MAG: RNA methyltransferase [Pseudomonadota bacterium]|nr:RNA methyltransferase [Pseudomonadota bacterium]
MASVSDPRAAKQAGPAARSVRQVTSLQNPAVKLVRSLELRKMRRETGLFVAEGAKVVATARDRGWTPRLLLVDEGSGASGIVAELIDWAAAAHAECLEVPAHILSKLSARDNPQTVIGVFPQRWAGEAAVQAGPADAWVALEEVRDPGNLGTIVRTVDAAGARGVILVGTCCDPYSREAVRATMGSIFNVPLLRMEHAAFLRWLTAWPGQTVGTHLSAQTDFRDDYAGPVLLVMGSEGPGLSAELTRACTRLVKIPMAGHADSLNLAIATALMLYEIRRPFLSL